MVKELIKFLNNCDLEELREGLDELDEKIKNYFIQKRAYADPIIVNETKNKDAYFYVWFCFLRANFLRMRDITSNKKFEVFVNNVRGKNFYFDSFPVGKLVPHLNWNPAGYIEDVLQEVRKEYNSGYNFVREIEKFVNKESNPALLHLKLVRIFKNMRGIGGKVANAIMGEIGWEIVLLREYNEIETCENLLKENWFKKLFVSSFFNVMVDTHVRKFSKNKLDSSKDVDPFTFVLIAEKIKKEVFQMLLDRHYFWIPLDIKKLLLHDYLEYVGANLIEKIIWMGYFAKKNLSRIEKIENLKLFKISGNLFL